MVPLPVQVVSLLGEAVVGAVEEGGAGGGSVAGQGLGSVASSGAWQGLHRQLGQVSGARGGQGQTQGGHGSARKGVRGKITGKYCNSSTQQIC